MSKLLFANWDLLEKEGIAPLRSKFFHFGADPVEKWLSVQKRKLEVTKVASLVENDWKLK